VSTTQLRYRVRNRSVSFFHYTGAGVYEEAVYAGNSGQYRFYLWR
jgi:hypothetical protein